MSSGAAGHTLSPQNDWKYSVCDQQDQPLPYIQEPVFEGDYLEDEEDTLMAPRNSNPPDGIDSVEDGSSNTAQQNQPQNLQYPQPQQNPAYRQQQQPQPSSRYIKHNQPESGGQGPPPNYNEHQSYANAKPGYDTYAYEKMQPTGQQLAYPAPTAPNDPQAVAVTYPLPPPGQCVFTQPQGFDGQPPVIIVQPMLQDPPNDYIGYSIFVCLCCCWIIGLFAIVKSVQCRKAIDVGNRELAKKTSIVARNVAHASLVVGILAYIILGILIGIRVAAITGKL